MTARSFKRYLLTGEKKINIPFILYQQLFFAQTTQRDSQAEGTHEVARGYLGLSFNLSAIWRPVKGNVKSSADQRAQLQRTSFPTGHQKDDVSRWKSTKPNKQAWVLHLPSPPPPSLLFSPQMPTCWSRWHAAIQRDKNATVKTHGTARQGSSQGNGSLFRATAKLPTAVGRRRRGEGRLNAETQERKKKRWTQKACFEGK